MASNHTQYNRNKNDRKKDDALSTGLDDNQASSVTISQEICRDDLKLTGETNRTDTGQKNDAQKKQFRPTTSSSSLQSAALAAGTIYHHDHHLVSRSIMNDALILRHRRAGLFKNGSKILELIGEDKIAKNKMDLIHWSEKSSTKATFMMAFSPNGQRVASTHGDHRIYICDLNTGQLVETLEGHPKTPWCFAWHPTDKDTLASGCLSGEVRVWDLRTKACELWTSEGNTIITSISFHPSERILAIATANNVHFWDWFENLPFAMTKSPNEKERVKYVEFDSSGTKLITGISNCTAIPTYSRDSLQNRIIDSYLNSNGNNIQQQQDNRTQNSEISSQHHEHRHRHHHHIYGHNHQQLRNDRSINSNQIINGIQVISHVPVAPAMGQSDQITSSSSLARSELIANSTNVTSIITMTLSKIACLYKNLEALEDSIRNTSFAPYNSSPTHQSQQPIVINRQTNNNNDGNHVQMSPRNPETVSMESESSDQSNQSNANNSDSSNSQSTNEANKDGTATAETPINHERNRPQAISNDNQTAAETPGSNIRTAPNAYEPLVVLFDGLLENVQLSSIVVRGRTLDITSLLARNPIDLSNHLDYVVQFESINQVNQNFIRISKLMSSVRLYRQIIQQILSSNSGSGHYQPNQFLTAQSLASHSSHVASAAAHHIPIVLRYGALPGAIELLEHDQQQQLNDGGSPSIAWNRPASDPILAIQFRNCARNVPLGSVCKADLLNARSICMVKSQQYLECSLANNLRSNQTHNLTPNPPSTSSSSSDANNLNDALAEILNGTKSSASSSKSANNDDKDTINDDSLLNGDNQSQIIEPFYSLLNTLQRVLSHINQTPLTTSNVHTQIASLRSLVDKLLTKFHSMIQTREEASRLVNLIHEISQNLTGRTWAGPLGRTFDELRSDVIHTFCMVDLTLHLARQVQLLQMQRISAIARIRDAGPRETPLATRTHDDATNQQASLQTQITASSSPKPEEINNLMKKKNDVPETVIASCSFTTDPQANIITNPNNGNCNYKINNFNNHEFLSNDNVTEDPPGKRRNNDKSSPSHLANKKAKIEPSSRTEMIDSSRQQTKQQQNQANNPVIDSLVLSPLNTSNNNHNNNDITIASGDYNIDAAIINNNNNNQSQAQGLSISPGNLSNIEADLAFEVTPDQLGSPARTTIVAQQLQQPISNNNNNNNNNNNIQSSNESATLGGLQRVYVAASPTNNLQIFMRIVQRFQGANATTTSTGTTNTNNLTLNPDDLTLDQRVFNTIPEAAAAALSQQQHQQQAALGTIEVRRRALSHDYNSISTTNEPITTTTTTHSIMHTSDLRHDHHHYHQQPYQHHGTTPATSSHYLDNYTRVSRRYFPSRPPVATTADAIASHSSNLGGPNPASNMEVWPRQHQSFHIIIPSHPRQNVLYMTLPTLSSANYRLQCWPFFLPTIPNIKDNISNVLAQRCRIDTNASIDISKDGNLIACLVPQEDAGHPMILRYELRILSLRLADFGACYYALPQGPQAFSVSLSPSARYVVVGLANGRQSLFSDGRGNNTHEDQDGLSIAKVFKLNETKLFNHVRDIKIKRHDLKTLNAIRWMPRGIVYNVGQHPMHHHRYQPRRSYQ